MIFLSWLCCSCVISTVVAMFYLKGRWSIYALKSKFLDFTSGLGPKDGFSMEVEGSILGAIVSTCSDLTLMELGATGEKDIWMLSPCLSMLALCSIPSTWSVLNNSAANKGCKIQTFCLLVLKRMIGTLLAFVVATQLLITMPGGRLWCWACSTRQVILGEILLVCPCTVIAELPGKQTGFCFEPIVTCPMVPFFLLKFNWSFFLDRSSVFGDWLALMFWDMTSNVALNVLFFHMLEWWKMHNWENNKGLTPSGQINESNPVVPYFCINTS